MDPQRHAGYLEEVRRAQTPRPQGRQAYLSTPPSIFRREEKNHCEEVTKLLAADFIMEVFHLEWLANPILVLKKNKTWRMCIDYTSLNKACPKDPFALPRIDQVIDSTARCELLSFLDAYSSYH